MNIKRQIDPKSNYFWYILNVYIDGSKKISCYEELYVNIVQFHVPDDGDDAHFIFYPLTTNSNKRGGRTASFPPPSKKKPNKKQWKTKHLPELLYKQH